MCIIHANYSNPRQQWHLNLIQENKHLRHIQRKIAGFPRPTLTSYCWGEACVVYCGLQTEAWDLLMTRGNQKSEVEPHLASPGGCWSAYKHTGTKWLLLEPYIMLHWWEDNIVTCWQKYTVTRTTCLLVSSEVKCNVNITKDAAFTLCCRTASKALNSKGREYVARAPSPANCGPSSKTSHFSKPSPRKSNTSRHSGVTTAFRDWIQIGLVKNMQMYILFYYGT